MGTARRGPLLRGCPSALRRAAFGGVQAPSEQSPNGSARRPGPATTAQLKFPQPERRDRGWPVCGPEPSRGQPEDLASCHLEQVASQPPGGAGRGEGATRGLGTAGPCHTHARAGGTHTGVCGERVSATSHAGRRTGS